MACKLPGIGRCQGAKTPLSNYGRDLKRGHIFLCSCAGNCGPQPREASFTCIHRGVEPRPLSKFFSFLHGLLSPVLLGKTTAGMLLNWVIDPPKTEMRRLSLLLLISVTDLGPIARLPISFYLLHHVVHFMHSCVARRTGVDMIRLVSGPSLYSCSWQCTCLAESNSWLHWVLNCNVVALLWCPK